MAQEGSRPGLTYPASLRGASLSLLPDYVTKAGEADGVQKQQLDGWTITQKSLDLGFGVEVYEAVSQALMDWRVHEGAGVRVGASLGTPAKVGDRVDLGIGPIRSSCEITAVIRDPDRTILTYGTLPGHVETGEESFAVVVVPGVVDHENKPLVRGACSAFSQPNLCLAKVGRPAVRVGQLIVTRRYLRAMRGIAEAR